MKKLLFLITLFTFVLYSNAQDKLGLSMGIDYHITDDKSKPLIMYGCGVDYNNFIVDLMYGEDVYNTVAKYKYYDYGLGYKFNYKKLIIGGYIGNFNTYITDTKITTSILYLGYILGFKLIDCDNTHLGDLYTKINKNGFGIYLTLKCF